MSPLDKTDAFACAEQEFLDFQTWLSERVRAGGASPIELLEAKDRLHRVERAALECLDQALEMADKVIATATELLAKRLMCPPK